MPSEELQYWKVLLAENEFGKDWEVRIKNHAKRIGTYDVKRAYDWMRDRIPKPRREVENCGTSTPIKWLVRPRQSAMFK